MKNLLTLIFCLFTLFNTVLLSQSTLKPIPLTDFYDSAHHWYDIHDEDHIFEPDSNQKKYPKDSIIAIANNILLYQKNNGGWPKNHDMAAILTENQKQKVISAKNLENTTIDNGATYSQIMYLSKVQLQVPRPEFQEACIKGIQFLMSAQYANGGFPQFFPETNGYRRHITFNDGAMIGVMNLFLDIVQKKKHFRFISPELYTKVKSAWEKGIQCIIKCQIVHEGERTVWCQQHDKDTYLPQNARTFEPAAICNGESAGIVLHLMRIKNPSDTIKMVINNAVAWFEKSKLHGIRVKTVAAEREKFMYHTSDSDRVVVQDSTALPIWPRFNELITLRPLFCRRDSKIVYSLAEVERERRTGYAWYIEAPREVIATYKEWQKKNK